MHFSYLTFLMTAVPALGYKCTPSDYGYLTGKEDTVEGYLRVDCKSDEGSSILNTVRLNDCLLNSHGVLKPEDNGNAFDSCKTIPNMDFEAGKWTADDNGEYYLKYQCRVDSTSSKTSSIAATSIYTVLEGGTVSCLHGPTASPKTTTTTTQTPHQETGTATTGTSTLIRTAAVDQ